MAKAKTLLMAVLLLFCGLLFYACSSPQLADLKFETESITIAVGDKADLGLVFAPKEAQDQIEFSVSDPSIVYVFENTLQVTGLKAGAALVYAKSNNGLNATIEVVVTENKTKLPTPTNMSISREDQKLSWMAVPGAFTYNIEIVADGETINVNSQGYSYIYLSSIENFELTTGKDYKFKVQAVPAANSTGYEKSDYTNWLTFNALSSVENLRYDFADNKVKFNYHTNLTSITFDIFIDGQKKVLNQNTSGEYSFANDKLSVVGEHEVKVCARQGDVNSSLSSTIKVHKLSTPTLFLQDGNVVASTQQKGGKLTITSNVSNNIITETSTEQQVAITNIELGSGQGGTATAKFEKTNKIELIDNVNNYYIDSNIANLTFERLITVSNFNVSKNGTSTNSVVLSWQHIEGATYLIYQNDTLISDSFVLDGNSCSLAINNIEAGEYDFCVVAQMEPSNNTSYFDSEKSEIKKVIKFQAPTISMNVENLKLDYTTENNAVGAQISFDILFGTTTNNIGKLIESTEETFSFEQYLLDYAGDYAIGVTLNKESGKVLYLDSNIININVHKLEKVQPTYTVDKTKNEIIVKFDKNEFTDNISIKLNGTELTTTVNENLIYRSEISTTDTTKGFTIKNIKNAGVYTLQIILNGYSNTDLHEYVVGSASDEYDFSKLAAPVVVGSIVNENQYKLTWQAVENAAKYKIVITNTNTNVISTFETTAQEYTFVGLNGNIERGNYEVKVIAISNFINELDSNASEILNLTKLAAAQNLQHSIVENNSIVTFNKVEGAQTYLLKLYYNDSLVKEFSSFSVEENTILFNLGNQHTAFDKSGRYKIEVVAMANNCMSSNANVIDNIIKLSALTKENISVEYGESATTLTIFNTETPVKYVIKIDSNEVQEITSNTLNITNLSAGAHIISIKCVGNSSTILDSAETQLEFVVKERLQAPTNVNFEVDSAEDRYFILTFSASEKASQYKILCTSAGNVIFETIYTPTEVAASYEIKILRSDFNYGSQSLVIIAQADAENFIQSVNSKDIIINKANTPTSLSLLADGTINLTGKQALIDSVYYENISLPWPTLQDGGTKEMQVRNILSIVDDYDAGDVFQMASDWNVATLIKLRAPKVNLTNDVVTWDTFDQSNVTTYAQIEYLGIEGKYERLEPTTIDISYFDNKAGVNVKQYLNLTNNAFVGDFKVRIYLVPRVAASQMTLIQESYKSSYLLNESAEDYRYTKQLNNNQASFSVSNEGNLNFNISQTNLLNIKEIELEIVQKTNSCKFKIDVENNLLTTISNSLNSTQLTLVSETAPANTNYKVNIFDLINSGSFEINWKLIGDEIYFFSATATSDHDINKLTAPEFTYESSNEGNKIILTSNTLTANTVGTYVATYDDEKREFTTNETSTYFIIPDEWTDLSKIKIFVETTEENFINSNESSVSFSKAESATNLHLTEDSSTGKTYLVWDALSSDINKFILHVKNNRITSIFEVHDNKFEITDTLLVAGDVQFRVFTKGYTSGGNIYLNADFTELIAEKLDNSATITTPNGLFTWDNLENESKMKEFRITVDNTIYNLSTTTHTFEFTGISGTFVAKFKLVGDPAQNIISSNNKEINLFKFNTPTSFKVSGGKFTFNETYDEAISFVLSDYRINVGDNGFNYSEYAAYSDIIEEQFYNALIANGGKAKAKAMAFSDLEVSYFGNTYLTLSSDFTSELDFGVYNIDVENDEFYLTQVQKPTGTFETYFNWNWVDETFVENGAIRIIIKPISIIGELLEYEGWTTVLGDNGNVKAYYKDFSYNNAYNNSNQYTGSNLTIKLPTGLEAGTYKLEVQKTALDDNINLSSQNVHVINFLKLEAPHVVIKNGVMSWEDQEYADHYLMSYERENVVKSWTPKLYETSFEPDKLYEDLSSNAYYYYILSAIGNVSELKPTENLSALSMDYILASGPEYGFFTKLKQTGDLKLENGALLWKEASSNYYTEENITSLIELVFENASGSTVLSLQIPASYFESGYPSSSILFNDLGLTDGELNILKNMGEAIIKYRQLGDPFGEFINSEYKYLTNENAPTITVNGALRNKFEVLKQIPSIKIDEFDGIDFLSPDINSELLQSSVFDVYFTYNDSTVSLVSTLTNKTGISFNDLKNLLNEKDPYAQIKEIFIVFRGNSSYYLSSVISPVLKVKRINGEASMIINDGKIQWNNIEGADSYEIKVEQNTNEYLYVVKYENGKYYVNDAETTCVEQENGVWRFDIAKYSGIADGNMEMYIRYLPKNEDASVYAIPGKWTTTPIRVFKIEKPTVGLSNGAIVWRPVSNASSYELTIVNAAGDEVYTSPAYQDVYTFEIDFNMLANYGITVENIGEHTFRVQAIGGGNINGVYYLSCDFDTTNTKTELTLKDNTISNVEINGDVLSWEDSAENSAYTILVSYTINGNNYEKAIQIPAGTYEYNLANLNLAYENGTVYSVSILNRGDNEKLSSEGTDKINFQVLDKANSLSVENGYVSWAITGGKQYLLSFTLNNYILEYTISKSGNGYTVTSLYRVVKSTGVRTVYPTNEEINIKFENGKISFWPKQLPSTSTTIVTLSCVAEFKDGVTYISSQKIQLASQIGKLNISTVEIKEFTRSNLVFEYEKFNTAYEIYVELVNQTTGKVIKLTLNNKTHNFDEPLQAGEYIIRIQVNPNNSTRIISDIKEFKNLVIE